MGIYAGHKRTHVNACMKMDYKHVCPTAVNIELARGNFAFSNKNFVRITTDVANTHTYAADDSKPVLFVNRIATASAFNFQQSISKDCHDACCRLDCIYAHHPTEQIRNRPSFNVNNAQHICDSEAVPLHRHNIINENPKMIGTNNKDNRGGRRRSFNGVIAAKYTDIPTKSIVYENAVKSISWWCKYIT